MTTARASDGARMRVVVATGNRGKAAEFGRLLGDRFAVEPLPEGLRLPPETGDTFAANAVLKARAAAAALGGGVAVLADDSGLVASALGDRPGVRSARYAGEDAGDAENVARLLADLEHETDRRARFVCVLALVLPDGTLVIAEGTLEGAISEEPRGAGGFGYDPVFVPQGWSSTLAEVSGEDKDAVSHRAQAVARLRRLLEPGEA